ncbi:MAG: hypothetical protein HWE27_11200 [Gammaproteobacteria bacterium]|nr:hypothetical protein [Gammaproteobacteria bacterium]
MNSKKVIACLGLTSILMVSNQLSASGFDIEEVRDLTLDASGASKLRIDAGAGFLKVKGVEGLSEVRVTAELMVDEDNYNLTLNKSGNKIVLVADANPENESSWWSDSPFINLTVELPKEMALDIDDGSGEIVIEQVNGDIDLEDGSGAISIIDIVGNLNVKDGSGSFSLKNQKGSLVLDDGSGSINIANVDGNVDIEDGSGSTTVDQITGKLNVEDGSGSLSISHVDGHVTIDDGSGGISLSHLANGVTILNEGSGGLSMSDVSGKVDKR